MITKVNNPKLALFILRLVVGSVFIAHGAQKVLTIISDSSAYALSFEKLGIPLFIGYLSAFGELIGGILMFFGIAAELGAALIIPIMVGAAYVVHGGAGYFAHHGGFEYALNLALLAFAIIVGGPGMWYLWDPFTK